MGVSRQVVAAAATVSCGRAPALAMANFMLTPILSASLVQMCKVVVEVALTGLSCVIRTHA